MCNTDYYKLISIPSTLSLMCCIFMAPQKSVKVVAHGPLNVKNAPTVNGALTAYLAHFLM